MIIGLEADFQGTSLSRSRVTGPSAPFETTGDVYTFNARYASPWLATVRGRIGFLASDRALVFATVGAGFARVGVGDGYGNDLGPGLVGTYTPLRSSGSVGGLEAGWVVGGGLEYALDPAWSIRAEFLHVGFGPGPSVTSGETLFGSPVANGFFVTSRGSFDENLARFGLNYHVR